MPEYSADLRPAEVSKHYDIRLPELSRWRRMQIPVIAGAVIAVIRALGPTLRFETPGFHHYQQHRARGEPVIAAFWHRCIIPATWYWRNQGVVVMNTTNFDGQWTRRVIEHFGFATAQGSSTRGGLRGLAVMARRVEEGFDAAFTIDGPRGPRYVAKPGPVMLARRTGKPIYVFHIGVEKARTLEKAWDLMQIPHPFTRAVMVSAPLDSRLAQCQRRRNAAQARRNAKGAGAREGCRRVVVHAERDGARSFASGVEHPGVILRVRDFFERWSRRIPNRKGCREVLASRENRPARRPA